LTHEQTAKPSDMTTSSTDLPAKMTADTPFDRPPPIEAHQPVTPPDTLAYAVKAGR